MSSPASADARSIAIIDDEPGLARSLARMFEHSGWRTHSFGSAEQFLHWSGQSDCILTDIRLPGMGGEELLRQLVRTRPQTPVVLMSAYGTLDTAMQAIRAGAFDYLAKPVAPADVQKLVARLNQSVTAPSESGLRLQDYPTANSELGLLGESSGMRAVAAFIARVAAYDATVLIQGESGVGKERVARAIHQASPRAQGPFISINCGAIPETLLESELFGVVRGAYTGADRDRPGVFGEAAGGTVLLDEIGELPLHLQVKLLRVLQEREIRPVGSAKSLPTDVRVVAASLREIRAEVAAGRFREDLYFRLNIMELRVPPLRERRDDIPLLTAAFLQRLVERYGKPIEGVDARAMERLREYAWPGNVRQLENVLERAYIMQDRGWITAESIVLEGAPAPAADSSTGTGWSPQSLSIKRESERLEDYLIRAALRETGGHQRRAAEILEISPRALIYKIQQYGIRDESKKPEPTPATD